MRYFPPRARQDLDLALVLRCCPHCMGDLEFRSDFTGEYYTCLQCSKRADSPAGVGPPAIPGPHNRARLTRTGMVFN
ncbi:MAG: hypothetical protein IIA90_02065 [Chloroflexi bacterium]|nr:hypothetical protein [Chloroflexota bacterium]